MCVCMYHCFASLKNNNSLCAFYYLTVHPPHSVDAAQAGKACLLYDKAQNHSILS